jgi:LysR family hydrogen peroxide-inducible transcriptional activator
MARATIRQLECVVAVADHHNFRRAAAALGLSQPALSAHVQGVERLFGVQVFERDRRSVLITPAGEDIVGHARLALAAVDAVAAVAQRRAEPLVGPLRLGVIPTVAPYWLPALLPPVRRRFPKLELILREEQTARLLAQLTAGQLDAALLALPVPGDFTSATIARESFVLAAPRGAELLRKRGRLSERDLEGEHVLLLEDGHCLRDQALAVCERSRAVEAVEVRATSLPTLVQMVAGGLGVTLLPEAAADALGAPNAALELAALGRSPPGRTLGLVWRTSSARLREFRMLAELLAEAAQAFLAKLRLKSRQ